MIGFKISSLYHSDEAYLKSKLNSSFAVIDEPVQENNILPKVQELIDSGSGDPGRLQHIYDMLSKNKPLYHSDQLYLESKLQPMPPETIVEVEPPKPKQVEYIPPPKPQETKLEAIQDLW